MMPRSRARLFARRRSGPGMSTDVLICLSIILRYALRQSELDERDFAESGWSLALAGTADATTGGPVKHTFSAIDVRAHHIAGR